MHYRYYQLVFILFGILASGLVTACHFTVIPPQSLSAPAQPSAAQPAGAQTPLTSATEFTSYQIFMQQAIDGSEVRYEYAWKQTNTVYGFDAGAAYIIGNSAGKPMQEEYLVGDKVYSGMMGMWGGGDRSADIAPMLPNLLTIPEEPSAFHHLPISGLVKQGRVVGQEVVNGVATEHLIVTDTQTIVTLILTPLGVSSNEATVPSVDIWRATGDGTVIQYTVSGLARYSATYAVFNINAPLEITPPAAAGAVVAQRQQAQEVGQIEHPTCPACLFPVPPEARVGYHWMSDGRFLILYLPVGGPTAAETAALYQTKLQGFGWQITEQDASGSADLPGYTYAVTDGSHQFTVQIGTANVGENQNYTQLQIVPDPPFPPPPAEDLVNTGQFEHTACAGCIFPAPPGSAVYPFMMSDHMMEVHCPATMSNEEVKAFYLTKLPEFGWQIDEASSDPDTYYVHRDGQTFQIWIAELQVNISIEGSTPTLRLAR